MAALFNEASNCRRFERCLLLIAFSVFLLSPWAFAAPTPGNRGGDPRSIQVNEKGVAAMKAKDFNAAEIFFKEALSIDRGNLSAVFNLAGVYMMLKQEAAAISLLHEYIPANPKDAGLFVRLGDAYFSSQNIQSAIKNWEHAYSVSPDYAGLASRLGTAYSMSNRPDAAIKMYSEATAQDPGDSQLFANLSALYLLKQKPNEAVSHAKQAIKLKPSAETYVTLGNAYEALSDYKNSLIAYRRAADLGDTSAVLKERIEELEKASS